MVRLTVLAAACAAATCVSLAALADDAVIYAPDGIALSGYDVVSYFTAGHAVRGNAKNALMWHGATWYFSSDETMDKFEMDPRSYMPEFGGYCAYAVAEGELESSEPDLFVVQDGHLYLLGDRERMAEFKQQRDALLAKAAVNWKRLGGE